MKKKVSIPWKKIIYASLAVILLILVLSYVVLIFIHSSVDNNIYNFNEIGSLEDHKVAIVFGASVNPETMLPSTILADRLKTGAEIYKQGKVEKLLVSGDNRVSHYNEPLVMQQYIEDLGIPAEDVVLDYAGRRTYDTCYRAKEIFGIDNAILVTQEYHLYRALYTCNVIGVDSIGVSASLQPYLGQVRYNIREIPATVLAWLQVHITKPKAQIMGEKEEIFN